MLRRPRWQDRLKPLLLTLIAAAGFALASRADLIPMGNLSFGSPLGSPTDEANYLQTTFGGSVVYLNKFDYDTGWDNSGAVDDSHFTVDPNSGEPTQAEVTWDLGGTGYTLRYVLVKDGQENGQHLYSLYGVTAGQLVSSGSPQTVDFNGIEKGISHISFFGQLGVPPATIPDSGASALLMGISLAGLAFFHGARKSIGA